MIKLKHVASNICSISIVLKHMLLVRSQLSVGLRCFTNLDATCWNLYLRHLLRLSLKLLYAYLCPIAVAAKHGYLPIYKGLKQLRQALQLTPLA